MPELRPGPGKSLEVGLEEYEAEILRRLGGEMQILLEADLPPADKVTARLFPAAYETAEEERAYRDLVGDELRDDKKAALQAMVGALGDDGPVQVTLTEDEIDQWLALITDLRLAIGTRLEVTEETMSQEVDPDDPDAPAYSILHWLGWLQESILEEVAKWHG